MVLCSIPTPAVLRGLPHRIRGDAGRRVGPIGRAEQPTGEPWDQGWDLGRPDLHRPGVRPALRHRLFRVARCDREHLAGSFVLVGAVRAGRIRRCSGPPPTEPDPLLGQAELRRDHE